MKKISYIIAAVVVINMLSLITFADFESSDKYLKGVWLSTVQNLDFPSKPGLTESEMKGELDDIVSTCVQMGINAIFFQVRPCADALYKSEIFPWSEVLSGTQGIAPDGDFDPLLYLTEKAHAKEIQVHAWINPYRIGKGSDGPEAVIEGLADSNPAKQHPEYYVVCSDGGVYFNPALEEVRQLIIDGIEEIVENYDVDGIHFDDYFYPYGVTDYPDAADYEKYGKEFDDTADFRRNNVNTLVRDVQKAIHNINPDVSFGISPFGIWDNKKNNPDGSDTSGMSSYSAIYADSRSWVQNGWVDYICPQIYWAFETQAAPFDILVDWWSKLCADTDVKLYIGHAVYKLGTDEKGFDSVSQLSRQFDMCCKSGVDGSVFFRYRNLKENLLGCADLIKDYSFEQVNNLENESQKFNKNAEKYIETVPLTSTELKITTPENGYRTTDKNVSVTGVADPGKTLTVNGKTLNVTEHGYFCAYLPLQMGQNTFTFVSGEQKRAITLTRYETQSNPEIVNEYFKPDSAYPVSESFFFAGQQVELSIYALPKLNVYANFMGKEIQLYPSSKSSDGFSMYSATVNVPNIMCSRSQEAPVTFYVKTDTGNVQFDKSGSSYVISEPVTLYTQYECYVYNEVSNGSTMENYQLPAGAKVKAVAMADGMYLLQSGKWINKNNVDNNPPESTDVDIDESKYTRIDLIFDSVPTFQSRVNEYGTFILELYGVADKPEIISQDSGINVSFIRYGTSANAVFNFESGAVEGFYVKNTDENTLSVWLYSNRKGGLQGKTVAIDPGHGGDDSGAVGPAGENGVLEEDLNLSVSYILAQKLKQAGANVILTRDDASTLPLEQRSVMIRSFKPDISISIHHNSVGRGSDFNNASGTVVLYSRETAIPLSKAIAERITDGLFIPNAGYKAQNLSLCRDYRYPCVLLECGFVCNPQEYEKLLTRDYKEKLCDNIVASLNEYFK